MYCCVERQKWEAHAAPFWTFHIWFRFAGTDKNLEDSVYTAENEDWNIISCIYRNYVDPYQNWNIFKIEDFSLLQE